MVSERNILMLFSLKHHRHLDLCAHKAGVIDANCYLGAVGGRWCGSDVSSQRGGVCGCGGIGTSPSMTHVVVTVGVCWAI